jgi:uncharacterized protein (DUF488 family)
MKTSDVLTIGHSNHPWPVFLALLRRQGVTALADIRSSPYSRLNPQFNRETLQRALQAEGIAYVFLGNELGARSEDPGCYVDGQVQFGRLAQTESFKAGLSRVMNGAASHRVAMMCAEKEPLECHRTLLVSRALQERGVGVRHILADGSVETHRQAMLRLLDALAMPAIDLFHSENERIADACALQEKKIAYINDAMRKD